KLSKKEKKSTVVDEYKNLVLKNILAGTANLYDNVLNKKQAFSSYFIVLADKLLDDKGTIAAVLPATILRTESNYELRMFLCRNYTLRFIISRNDALNFSDDTTLKEILFILKKQKPREGDVVCYITLNCLKERMAADIQAAESGVKPDGFIYRFGDFSIQKRLQESLDPSNLFGPIALNSIDLQNTWSEIEGSPMFRSLRTFEKTIPRTGRMIITREGAASRCHAKLPQMAVVKNRDSKAPFQFDRANNTTIFFKSASTSYAVDMADTFKYVRNAKNPTMSLNALNEFVIWKVDNADYYNEIQPCTIINIKQAIDTFNAASRTARKDKEYTIGEIEINFPELHDALKHLPGKKIAAIANRILRDPDFSSFQEPWTTYLSDKLCYLATVDALHIEAPNTYFYAYFAGEERRVFSSIFLNVPCLETEEAKINCLWLNSALNMIQLFTERNPTGWFKIKQFILEGLKIIDINKLEPEARKLLLSTFESVSNKPFLCMWQQFFVNIPDGMIDASFKKELIDTFKLGNIEYIAIRTARCLERKEIDAIFMKIFFPSKKAEEIEQELHCIYLDLVKEIMIEKRNITKYKPRLDEEDSEAMHDTEA
nr:hypothetical protein [Candidatus Sigynarchaeota archaeon]